MSDAPVPIACDLDAIPAAERPRYHALRARILGAAVETVETRDGFRLRLSGAALGDGALADLAAWMGFERLCCPFLRFTLDAPEGGALHLAIEGPEGVKAFLRAELALHLDAPHVPVGSLARRSA
jgi:hypothetical protein